MNEIEKYEHYTQIETIKENPEIFLELLNTTEEDYNKKQIVSLFRKWESERKQKSNLDKVEEINYAYFNLIDYIKNNLKEIENFKSNIYYLLKPFLKLEYDDFKGLINLFEDTKDRDCFEDIVIYWGHHRTKDELKYAILAGGFDEPEVYENLKQKSLKLSYKNKQND